MRGEISSDRFFFVLVTLSCGAVTRDIWVVFFGCDSHGVIRYPFEGPFHEASSTAVARSRTGDKFLLGEFNKLAFALGIP